jgi:hypothetical protein
MRLNEKNAESLETTTAVEALEAELIESILADHRSYHELEDAPILETDILNQFKTNLKVLADLTSRLSFLNREIRYVMKVD